MLHKNDEMLHKNGIGSAAGLAQLQQYNDLFCDEDGAMEQPSSTMETDRTGIRENGVANSEVSEEIEEEEQQGLQDGLNSVAGVDIDVNNDAYDEPLDMEPVDYVQEELYETVKEAEKTHEEGSSSSSSSSNNIVDNDMNNEGKQKELESVDGKQDFEQLESTQSSQPVSSSSSSYNSSPVAHRKGTRVSVHRELDVNYEQSTTDTANVRLYCIIITSDYAVITS